MIHTLLGPVDLRRPRQPEKIRLYEYKGDKEVTIIKGWLTALQKGKTDIQSYRMAVTQAMMLASARVALQDIAWSDTVDATGAARVMSSASLAGIDPVLDQGLQSEGGPTAARERLKRELEARVAGLRDGRYPVPIKVTSGEGLSRVAWRAKKHRLFKRGFRFARHTRHRWFIIDSGKLKEYTRPGQETASDNKPRHVYELVDAVAAVQTPQTDGLAEPFEKGYQARVQVQLRDRPHGPIYLYTEDARQAKVWERAIRMSKYMLSAEHREALAFVVGRAAGSRLAKGWMALFDYWREMEDTRHTVRNFAMRLTRSELSRGFTKLRMVYQRAVNTESLRKQRRDMAIKFLQDQLESLNARGVRSSREVRDAMISNVQRSFRSYRQSKLFDREYPLGTSVVTRPQQARAGGNIGSSLTSLKREEALQLALGEEAYRVLIAKPGFLRGGQRGTYSQVNVPVAHRSVNVSECLTMLSLADLDVRAELTHLARGSWEHFVNLDQISSVVLRSERKLQAKGGQELHPSMTQGVWFTINGPRVCWGRRLAPASAAAARAAGAEGRQEVVGATAPLELGRALAGSHQVRRLKVSLQVRSSYIPQIRFHPDGRERPRPMAGEEPAPQRTFLVLHLLGRRFVSPPAEGEAPVYSGVWEAEVPVSSDGHAVNAHDESEVCVDVVEWLPDSQSWTTVYAGRVPLWQVFRPMAHDWDALSDSSRMDAKKEDVVGLMHSLAVSGTGSVKIPLMGPSLPDEVLEEGNLELEATARVAAEEAPEGGHCISPELQGCGPITQLFTAHRGAWGDPRLDEANFSGDNAANFIQLRVKQLMLPFDLLDEGARPYQYYVTASCGGVTAATLPLHRPKEIWNRVLPMLDTARIDFQGTPLLVPLPPGAWYAAAAGGQPPELELRVFRGPVIEERPITYNQLVSPEGPPRRRGPPVPEPACAFHAVVSLEGLALDQVRESVDVFLSPSSTAALKGSLVQRSLTAEAPPSTAVLVVGATLRDRDFARLHAAADRACQTLGQGAVLCVGDRATLRAEEPLSYPATDLEFRRRQWPGEWDEHAAARGGTGGWPTPLRAPSLTHEYESSRLEKANRRFERKHLPKNVDDVLPYQYILPDSEYQFLREARAGVYWRVMERLVGKSVIAKTQELGPVIVDELTHVVRQIPVTVLAVYSNGTCDLELLPSFVREWERRPQRLYALPGKVVIRRFEDTSAVAVRLAPTGAGDVAYVERIRVVLREVPLRHVVAVQAVGFNIYDASFASVDDAISVPPGVVSNDFSPAVLSHMDDEVVAARRRGGYALRAGPVPADVGPACRYEWSLHLHARTEEEMNQFVTVLRHSVQMDNFQRVLRLEGLLRQKRGVGARYTAGNFLSSAATGHLEVVLVEARDLIPPRFAGDKDVAETVRRLVLPDPHVRAEFRILAGGEELIFKGSKSQSSPIIVGSRPSWAAVPELEASGGWVFRSPLMDLKQVRMQDPVLAEAVAAVEPFLDAQGTPSDWTPALQQTLRPLLMRSPKLRAVVQAHGWVGTEFKAPPDLEALLTAIELAKEPHFRIDLWNSRTCLGTIRVKLLDFQAKDTSPPVNLCEPETPFHNLWIPLQKLGPTGMLVPGSEVFGMVHVMTLWVPQNQTVVQQGLPKRAADFLLWQLRPKLQATELHERLNDQCMLQVHKRGYDPNCFREDPLSPVPRATVVAQHVRAMEDLAPLLDCYDAQDGMHWDNFLDDVGKAAQSEAPGAESTAPPLESLAEYRQKWGSARATAPERQLANRFDKLVLFGIPRHQRKEMWWDLTLSGRTMAGFPGAGSFDSEDGLRLAKKAYRTVVSSIEPFRCDAVRQLSEDVLGLCALGTSQSTLARTQHLRRLQQAEDVCLALIGVSVDFRSSPLMLTLKGQPNFANGVAYCESVLVLAFYLLVAFAAGGAVQEPAADDDESPGRHGGGDDPHHSFLIEEHGHRGSRRGGKSPASAIGDHHGVDEADEVRVFWLLFGIIGSKLNGPWAFRDYYGMPYEYGTTPSPQRPRGAAEDVELLGACLSRLDNELWTHLAALGFHLSIVFHGAFMRLYATYLPTNTCFRLWDVLFAECTPRDDRSRLTPPRHTLIDLAYATLRDRRTQLLACQSVPEARATIVDFLERAYDATALLQLVKEAEIALWEPPLVGVSLPHSKDYEREVGLWKELHHDSYPGGPRYQNEKIKDLVASVSSNPQADPGSEDTRFTAMFAGHIVRELKEIWETGQIQRSDYIGMHRPLAAALLQQLGVCVDRSIVGTVRGLWNQTMNVLFPPNPYFVMGPESGFNVPKPDGTPESSGEPTHMPNSLSLEQWVASITRSNWGIAFDAAFHAFKTRGERVSANEFFGAIICFSKGTVGEKALAFFDLYGYHASRLSVAHCRPVSHAAAKVVERIQAKTAEDLIALVSAPDEREVREMCLHFKIYTWRNRGAGEALLAEAFIPTLEPFMASNIGDERPLDLTMWGLEMELPPDMLRGMGGGDFILSRRGARPNIGTMRITIRWIPESEDEHEVGQLGLHLHHVQFNEKHLDAPEDKNPNITVCTYDDSGEAVQIPRMDRGTMIKRARDTNLSFVGALRAEAAELTAAGPSGEFIEFTHTMRRDPLGNLHYRFRDTDHGWSQELRVWQWSQRWGEQWSSESFRMRSFAKSATAAHEPNVISLQACRLITKSILDRSLLRLTNRQVCQIADDAFSRSGAVPGVLDALLVPQEAANGIESAAALKAELERNRWTYADVKLRVLQALEESANLNPGPLVLFPNASHGQCNLSDMGILDPMPARRKVLWIRYVQGGDGQRINARIEVGADGTFLPTAIRLDMAVRSGRAGAADAALLQLSLTKEEFVTCLMSSPLLGESLRQLSSMDADLKGVEEQSRSLQLHVLLADPEENAEDEEMLDRIAFRQGVLLEVYDQDRGYDDFLGEAWLPTLSALTPELRAYVLELNNAPRMDDGEFDATLTRPDDRKQVAAGVVCKGNLYVEAAWRFPAEDPDLHQGESQEERVKRAEVLHTGELHLRIVRAEGLRTTGGSGIFGGGGSARGSNPYVSVYVRNETPPPANGKGTPGLAVGGWKCSTIPPYGHEPILETSIKKNTLEPVWEEEVKVNLMTGAFERRALKRGIASPTQFLQRVLNPFANRQAEEEQDALDRLGMGDGDGDDDLELFFGSGTLTLEDGTQKTRRDEGFRHEVSVHVSDSIHEFKSKIVKACEQEARLSQENKAKWKKVAESIAFAHQVLAFVPPQRLLDLQMVAGGEEYRQIKMIEEKDPCNWQPLDLLCTFDHYQVSFGFSTSEVRKLRVEKGTAEYAARNARYRRFEEEQAQWRRQQTDLNTDTECFGYARYLHKSDGNSVEWRQAIIGRPDDAAADGRRRCPARFLHCPKLDGAEVAFDSEALLLAPAVPRILRPVNAELQAVLAKAPAMSSEGLTDAEIASRLTAELRAKYSGGIEAPPPITVAEVRNALRDQHGGGIAGAIRAGAAR